MEPQPGRDASLARGLFYRFKYGADIEFICLDTSKDSLLLGRRMFERDPGKTWMRAAPAVNSPSRTDTWAAPYPRKRVQIPATMRPTQPNATGAGSATRNASSTDAERVTLSGPRHTVPCPARAAPRPVDGVLLQFHGGTKPR